MFINSVLQTVGRKDEVASDADVACHHPDILTPR